MPKTVHQEKAGRANALHWAARMKAWNDFTAKPNNHITPKDYLEMSSRLFKGFYPKDSM